MNILNLARPVRVLFFGNSIMAHDPNLTSGWPWYWGMGATSADLDYVHRVQLGLAAHYGIVPEIKLISADVNRAWDETDVDGRTMDMESTAWDFAPDIVIVEMGDNAPLEPDVTAWLAIMRKIVTWTPSATHRIAVGLWAIPTEGDLRETAIRNIAGETGVNMTYVKIHDLHVVGVTDGAPHGYTDGGVKWHPGNRGMGLIADRILDVLL